MSKSFDIGRFRLAPGRSLYGLVVGLPGKNRAVENVLSFLSEKRIEVVYGTYYGDREKGRSLVFLDFTDSSLDGEGLVGELKRLGLVDDAQLINPGVEGFVADNLSVPLLVGQSRAVIFRDIAIRGFIDGIREDFGSGGEAFTYYTGFRMGLEFGKGHIGIGEKIGIKDRLTIFRSVSASLFNAMGYGLIETVELTPDHTLLRVYQSFECEHGSNKEKPYSNLIRGMIAGVLTEFFGRKFNVQETQCIAKGDAYCEFEAFPEDDIETSTTTD